MTRRAIRHLPAGVRRQRGVATLVVAVLLLGIISIMTLFSLSYAVQDRRVVGDATAVRLAQEAAQAGLDQGLQFFRANAGDVAGAWLVWPTARWQRCAADDTSAPCGAVAASVRANYLRYDDARGGRANPATLDMHDTFRDGSGTPLPQLIPRIGNRDVTYDVYALLCLVDTAHPEAQCLASGNSAAPEVNGKAYAGPYAITLIARSRIAAADANAVPREAVLKQTIATRGTGERVYAGLGVVPGSWSDAGRIDGGGRYAEN